MSISAQELAGETISSSPQSRIEVARAMPRHAHTLHQIYKDGRVAAQPHGSFTAADILEEFADPNSTLEGRTTAQWERMIMDRSAHGVVFASFVVFDPEARVKGPDEDTPRGVVRAVEVNGVKFLKNLYVASGFHRQGHGTALFNRVKEEFSGGEFRVRPAAHNKDAINFYKGNGCVDADVDELGYMMRGSFIKQVELISPAA